MCAACTNSGFAVQIAQLQDALTEADMEKQQLRDIHQEDMKELQTRNGNQKQEIEYLHGHIEQLRTNHEATYNETKALMDAYNPGRSDGEFS